MAFSVTGLECSWPPFPPVSKSRPCGPRAFADMYLVNDSIALVSLQIEFSIPVSLQHLLVPVGCLLLSLFVMHSYRGHDLNNRPNDARLTYDAFSSKTAVLPGENRQMDPAKVYR